MSTALCSDYDANCGPGAGCKFHDYFARSDTLY